MHSQPSEPTADDVAKRDHMAELYRARGWNPLPSELTAESRKPFVRYSHLWSGPAVDPDAFAKFPSANLQVMLGRHWRLLVIDLDGDEAIERWTKHPRRKPRTWITHSGGGGQHWWFRLPENYPHPLRKAVLWQGEGKHSAIERLCDGSLIIAPPSIHPRTGNRYRFLDAQHSPAKLSLPADCPDWLLAMPDVTPRQVVPMTVPIAKVERAPVPTGSYRAADVLAAIPDVIELCRSLGVRFATDTGRDWVPCYGVDREDRVASAAVHRITGRYVDRGTGASIGLFDLAATMGLAGTWREAVAVLGERYRAREAS